MTRLRRSLIVGGLVISLIVPTGPIGAGPPRSEGSGARWSVPDRPDLSKCQTGLHHGLRPCTNLVNEYGREVAARAARARSTSQLPPSATQAIIPTPCSKRAFRGAFCARVKVPLDREQPDGKKISIAFELYTHTRPGPAESAILVNFGGPGVGTIPTRGGAFLLFGDNLETHDLLLIDDRGRGYSSVIDCPSLDNRVGTIAEQVAQCANILGDASDEYGSGDVALDTNAVREAIGYELVDYYGVSYGGADITAFATRFPQHIRSLILDSPWGDTLISEEIYDLNFFVDSTLDVFKRVCRRSPTCRSGRNHPAADFAGLVQHVRLNPVTGTGYRPDGTRKQVNIDTKFLIEYLMLPGGSFTNMAEISAAAAALDKGDRVPLLRLAAENYFPTCCQEPQPDSSPPRFFSLGAFVATFCVDNQWEWDWSSSIPQRKIQHQAALSSAPQELFYPFTGPEAAKSTFVGAPYCIRWPEPIDAAPMAEPGANYPEVPTFVLGGDFDNLVPIQQTRLMSDKFPGSQLVEFKSATHGAAFSECGIRLVSRFVETLELGETKCARKPQSIVPAVGEFPLAAREAKPAKVSKGEGNRAKAYERKVAAVAAATVRDVVERASLSFAGTGRVTGQGLRGGRTETRFKGRSGLKWRIRLKNVRFAEDVPLSGRVRAFPDGRLKAKLNVSGAAEGHVDLRAKAYPGGGVIKIRGLLDGHKVRAFVPQE